MMRGGSGHMLGSGGPSRGFSPWWTRLEGEVDDHDSRFDAAMSRNIEYA